MNHDVVQEHFKQVLLVFSLQNNFPIKWISMFFFLLNFLKLIAPQLSSGHI